MIDKNEVLRYMGYRGQQMDDQLNQLIDEAIAECVAASHPLSLYRFFDIAHTPEGVVVQGTKLVLTGNSIAEHLKSCSKIAIMAATLGVGIEARIRRFERTSMTKSVILDSAGTDYIEKVCDKAEEEIKQEAARLGFYTNFRFSPGYGDLPLELQPDILAVLQAEKKIGLTCTENLIMLPRKSVTAIIGLLPEPAAPAPKNRCALCSMASTCTMRKRGTFCGHPTTDKKQCSNLRWWHGNHVAAAGFASRRAARSL